jgi:hypothetical protein
MNRKLIDQLLPSEKQKLLQALGVVERATQAGNEQAASEAMDVVKNLLAQFAPATTQDLQAKREARLWRETWDSLSPEQQKAFEATHGDRANLRRLADEAKRIADSQWEQQQLAEQNKKLEAGRWEGQQFRTKSPSANYDKLVELSNELEQKREDRLRARRERELAAEIHDDEKSRLISTMTREEYDVFLGLLKNQPTPLQKLQQFAHEQGINPIQDVNNSADLYEIGLRNDSQFNHDEPKPIDSGTEVDQLYNQALKEMTKGE